jgi:hypothetical protein
MPREPSEGDKMKTKQLIALTVGRDKLNEVKLLTTINIAYEILKIMRKHIGNENAISRSALFKRVFGRDEEITLSDELRWDYVKKAMRLCRTRTRCFIGNMCDPNGVWKFFVLKTTQDARYYIDGLERNIKAMRYMQVQALKSVERKDWEKDWLENRKLLQRKVYISNDTK